MKPNYHLPKKAIDALAKALDELLANNMVLYTKTLNAHWNLVDPRFISLHLLFEEHYKALQESGDLIAERIRMMGIFVDARLSHFQKRASLKEFDAPLSGNAFIDALASDHEATVKKMREVIALSEKLKDPGTVDMLSSLLRDHEKIAWFLRSHLI